MKKTTSLELGVLVFAAIFIVVGLIWLVWPETTFFIHPTNSLVGNTEGFRELVSERGMRWYGVLAVIFGAAAAAWTLHRGES